MRIDGATVTLDDVIIDKSAGATSGTENGDFYGMNAGLLALNAAQVTINNATANITVSNATQKATSSEAVVVEGKNSVTLIDSDVAGNMSGPYQDAAGNIHNISQRLR